MKKFKALYKGMYDDLKDAEMMIEYACEIKEHPEDKHVADEMAQYAKFRLDHFMTFHEIFTKEAAKQKDIDSRTVAHCMWEEQHEHMQEWYDSIERKIMKYN